MALMTWIIEILFTIQIFSKSEFYVSKDELVNIYHSVN